MLKRDIGMEHLGGYPINQQNQQPTAQSLPARAASNTLQLKYRVPPSPHLPTTTAAAMASHSQLRRLLFGVIVACTLVFGVTGDNTSQWTREHMSNHTNNWAVIVDTSIFWFNYRHIANALSVYRVVKSLGIPDNQIILMLADDIACNPRNILRGEVYNDASRHLQLYDDDVEVDYRGEEVTVENFVRVLSGRHLPGTPASKRLDTDDGSNVLVYMTGHGGNEFLKFSDSEEIGSQDIGDCFRQMWDKQRYNQIFFAIDTCQAATMLNSFDSPNIVAIGSSLVDENSYSHHGDGELGVTVIDRFTYHMLKFVEDVRRMGKTASASLADLFKEFTPERLHSHVGIKSSLSRLVVSFYLIALCV
jgi:phosphatidylinositol glycan class K